MVPMSYMPMGWPGHLGLGLEAEGTWTPETGPNWPNGTHFSEVEIDPDTGFVELVRHIAVNDSGEVINPLLLGGQVHGGVAQGVGQALMEDVTYDSDGQILAGSFMDYCMPRADDLPMIETADFVEACQTNPLGVKGGGESGTVGSTAAVVNAIVDALAEYGVKDIEMPATPMKVWQAMHGGKAALRGGAAKPRKTPDTDKYIWGTGNVWTTGRNSCATSSPQNRFRAGVTSNSPPV